MANIALSFASDLNASLSIGDTVYSSTIENGAVTDSRLVGVVNNIADRTIFITIEPTTPRPSAGEFVYFTKDKAIEGSGIIGYEAMVTMLNDSTSKAELFAVSSEVFESSK